MDPKVDDGGRSFIERMALLPTDLPLVVCPSGNLLKRPNERELAACLGIILKSISGRPTTSPSSVRDRPSWPQRSMALRKASR